MDGRTDRRMDKSYDANFILIKVGKMGIGSCQDLKELS